MTSKADPKTCRHFPAFNERDELVCTLCGKKFKSHKTLNPKETAALLGAEPPTKKKFIIFGGLGAFFINLLNRKETNHG
jgi:uncharacterized membrane protein YvbJ